MECLVRNDHVREIASKGVAWAANGKNAEEGIAHHRGSKQDFDDLPDWSVPAPHEAGVKGCHGQKNALVAHPQKRKQIGMGVQKTSQRKAGLKAKTAIEGECVEIISVAMEERSHVEGVLRRENKERQHD